MERRSCPPWARASIGSTLLAASCLAWSCEALPSRDARGTPQVLALVGGTVVRAPDVDPIRDGVVLVQDGEIAAVGESDSLDVPRGAIVVDCRGATVAAGYWNCHVHFAQTAWRNAAHREARELSVQLHESFLAHGFTTVVDTGSPLENTLALRDRVDRGPVQGPRILTTGEPLIAPGAMPPDAVLEAMGWMPVEPLEVRTPGEAARAAEQQLARGSDALKLHLQPPLRAKQRLGADTIARLAALARQRDVPLLVHPFDTAEVAACVRAHVAVVLHTTPSSSAWDESVAPLLADSATALTPTLALWRMLESRSGPDAPPLLASARAQLAAWRSAGGRVLFGTDFGAVADGPAVEVAEMAAAGMTSPEILASLTTAPAERFGESARRGRVEPGLAADLVVVEGDPLSVPSDWIRIRTTLRAGVVVHCAVLGTMER